MVIINFKNFPQVISRLQLVLNLQEKKNNCDLDFPHLLLYRCPWPNIVYHLIIFDSAFI